MPIDPTTGLEVDEEEAARLAARTNFHLAQQPAVVGDEAAVRAAAAKTFAQTALPNELAAAVTASRPSSFEAPQPAPGAAPAAEAAPAAIPDQTKTVTDSRTVTTREKATAGELKAVAEIQKSEERAVDLVKKQTKIDVERARVEGERKQALAGAAAEEQKRVNTVADEGRRRMEAAQTRLAAEQDRLARMEFKDFWADKTTGQRVLSRIGVALGAAGAAMAKIPNFALQMLNSAIEQDFAVQRFNIDKQKQVAQAEGGVLAARQWREDALRDLDIRRAGAERATAAQVEAEASKRGTDVAQLNGAKAAEGLRMQAAQREQKWQEGQRVKIQSEVQKQTVTGTGGAGAGGRGGQPTESQAKMALLAEQMRGELKLLERLPGLTDKALEKMQSNQTWVDVADRAAAGGAGKALLADLGRKAGVVPKSKYAGLSEKDQQVANAWDNVLEKYTRLLTGAGMPADEARRMALQDAPHAGDAPAVRAQKLERMRNAAAQMMALSGTAAARVQAATPGAPVGAPAAAPAAAGGRRGKVNGKPAMIFADGSYELVQ